MMSLRPASVAETSGMLLGGEKYAATSRSYCSVEDDTRWPSAA